MQRVIYAHGVHTGGGLTLLKALLDQLTDIGNYQFILDLRTKGGLKDYDLVNFEYFPAGIIGRLKSELYLRSNAQSIEAILSFNSLPFVLPVPVKTTIFFQNVNLIASVDRTAMMSSLRRALFRLGVARIDKFVVQTETVSRQLSKITDRPLFIGTLLDQVMLENATQHHFGSSDLSEVRKRFVYVADAAPHKNHILLLKAWELLHEKFPELDVELYLTLPQTQNGMWREICQRFDTVELSVRNEGILLREHIFELYEMCDVLVFPSLHESLGLPLLEATQYELDIIAPERDYVRDIVIPAETFDPQSYISLARALARYLGLRWPSGICPMSSQELLSKVFDEERRNV